MMLKGLMTHFNAPVDRGLLRELQARGVQMCRMDCQHVDNTMLGAMIDDVMACGMMPLPILNDETQLAAVLPGGYAELLNEPDIARMPTAEYRQRFATFALTAVARGITPCGPVISNLTHKALGYLQEAMGPSELAGELCSVHRYPPGTNFTVPHTGFATRAAEVESLRESFSLTGPIGVSEFGYNSHDQSDAQALDNIRGEFSFWEGQGAVYAVLYQLNDGPANTVMDRYGVRRVDGSWKPQIEAFA